MEASENIRRNVTRNSQGAIDVSDLLNNKDGSLLEDGTAVSDAVGELRKGLATRNVTNQILSGGMNGFGTNNETQNFQSFRSLLEEGTVVSGAVGDFRKGLATRNVMKISQGSSTVEDGRTRLKNGSSRPGRLKNGSSRPGRLKDGISLPGRLRDGIPLPGRLRDGISLPGDSSRDNTREGILVEEDSGKSPNDALNTTWYRCSDPTRHAPFSSSSDGRKGVRSDDAGGPGRQSKCWTQAHREATGFFFQLPGFLFNSLGFFLNSLRAWGCNLGFCLTPGGFVSNSLGLFSTPWVCFQLPCIQLPARLPPLGAASSKRSFRASRCVGEFAKR